MLFEDGDIFTAAERFNAPVKAVETSKGDGQELPMHKSYLRVENAVFSAITRESDGDGYILRVFNPSDETKVTNIRGTELTLGEETVGEFNGEIKPYKIVSVKLS